MKKVVGIDFKEVGKIYWFDVGNFKLKANDKVVVETIRGLELGTVVQEILEVAECELEHELKPVIRVATKNDLKAYEDNLERAQSALKICKKIVKQHKLEMKLLECEYTLDRQKIIFYYNADGRVDFRELLKDLASEFKTRIELRQIGPREGAKFIGGLGPCGRECCCVKHLREFDLVTMKMAKEQGMTLNASKVAGLCGKLMCCIGYESSFYEEIRNRMPLVGDLVRTPNCEVCKVVGVDYLREIIKTSNEDKIEVWQANELEKVESYKQEDNPNDLTDDVIENGIDS
ncbi:MAG TPA: stage 0 sporulation family protein [Acholeplasmataceae bacterium]|jgi:cell fate regulator YaaT (PSP1 superfamily)|nr:stage 0 sporulation family protein [Acholeplasmataceae bacterium]